MENPLLDSPEEFGVPDRGLKARDLQLERCAKPHAVKLCRQWHSRLPNTQRGPWQFAFKAHYMGVTYSVALWNNPSARTLPGHWLELRRLANSPDSPYNTSSRFLAWMVRYFEEHCPEREKCISYQDTSVHEGTIYKAANWEVEHISRARERDRSSLRKGTNRKYRKDVNGKDPATSEKKRWAIELNP